ncbi:MAG TPA: ATP-binding protein [Patescibacteria group bacterium]|nr:ATP-binding protein [Patescibacteria group bacterium]
MTSMRRQLLLQVMIALFAVSIVVSGVSYLSTRDEINELFDENFKQIALVLEGQRAVLADSKSVMSRQDHLKGEEEFLIQLWSPDLTLLYSTHPLITFPPPAARGFATRDYQGAAWRSFSTRSQGTVVQIAQPLSGRREMIFEIALQMLLPTLLQFPVLGLLIWLAVGRSLGSLAVISGSLQKKSETSLQPLPSENIPEEIVPLVRALNDLLKRLDEAMKLQRRFTADAAHELRTPLAAVNLQLELLSRTKDEAERVEAVGNLTQGVQRSIRLVEQLLAFARLEAKEDSVPATGIDALPLCQEAVKYFSDSAVRKNIDLGLVRQEPAPVLSDAESLRTVIGNLLENALRYTPENGQVDVHVYSSEKHAVIEVWDNGVGIPPEEQARIFDRFYRVPGSGGQGTGLGLAIVKNLLDRDGADISIASGIGGRGTCVKIIYPKAPL